jgi:hypothetical protein
MELGIFRKTAIEGDSMGFETYTKQRLSAPKSGTIEVRSCETFLGDTPFPKNTLTFTKPDDTKMIAKQHFFLH